MRASSTSSAIIEREPRQDRAAVPVRPQRGASFGPLRRRLPPSRTARAASLRGAAPRGVPRSSMTCAMFRRVGGALTGVTGVDRQSHRARRCPAGPRARTPPCVPSSRARKRPRAPRAPRRADRSGAVCGRATSRTSGRPSPAGRAGQRRGRRRDRQCLFIAVVRPLSCSPCPSVREPKALVVAGEDPVPVGGRDQLEGTDRSGRRRRVSAALGDPQRERTPRVSSADPSRRARVLEHRTRLVDATPR